MNNHKLPSAFTDRMEKILGKDFYNFINEIENGQATKALFFNSSSVMENVLEKAHLEQIPFSKNGCYFDYDSIGNTPLHHAGAYYIQDPSAMATIEAVSHLEFSNILDCCASPGGKTLSAWLHSNRDGVIVSNEYNVSRCKTLVGNIERFSMKNAIVTNFDMTEKNGLNEVYDSYFDLVVCDAPCSGEGMFRKYPAEAIGDWSIQNVLSCAVRQKSILDTASSLVKNGGYLLYSTCTFSLDENEIQINSFMKSHPEFSLIPVSEKVQKVTSEGYLFEGCDESISLCRRFYPHISKGEGQFIALLQKNADEKTSKSKYSSPLSKPADSELKALRDFTSKTIPDFDLSKVYKYNENLIYVNFEAKIPSKKVFSCGVKLGNVEKNRFIPHHQFFKCFGEFFKNKVDFSECFDDCSKYLHGEVINVNTDNGWCAVVYRGFILGGGKVVDGTLKNHYPKGLRTL